MSHFWNNSDIVVRERKTEEYLIDIIFSGVEVALKRSELGERERCKIRELSDDLVIVEFENEGNDDEKRKRSETDTQDLKKLLLPEDTTGKVTNFEAIKPPVHSQELDIYGDTINHYDSKIICTFGENPSCRTSNQRFFTCVECEKFFVSQHSLNKHIMEHQNGKTEPCMNIKEYLYQAVLGAQDHLKQIGFDDSFKSKSCKLGFSYRKDTEKHGSQAQHCQYIQGENCGKMRTKCERGLENLKFWKGKVGMSSQQCKILGKGSKAFSCNSCRKNYVNQRSLNRHLRVHEGERPYLCLICGKRYSYKHDLHNHVKSHTECIKEIHKLTEYVDKPFMCETCGRQFPFKFDFEKHLSMHLRIGEADSLLKDKPHKEIDTCLANEEMIEGIISSLSKSSSQSEQYSNNRELTSQPSEERLSKIFKCTVCQRKFSYKRSFLKHLARHSQQIVVDNTINPGKLDVVKNSNDDPENSSKSNIIYRPVECGDSPEARCAPLVHQEKAKRKRKAGERPFQCTFCGKTFAYEKTMCKHIKCHLVAPDLTKTKCKVNTEEVEQNRDSKLQGIVEQRCICTKPTFSEARHEDPKACECYSCNDGQNINEEGTYFHCSPDVQDMNEESAYFHRFPNGQNVNEESAYFHRSPNGQNVNEESAYFQRSPDGLNFNEESKYYLSSPNCRDIFDFGQDCYGNPDEGDLEDQECRQCQEEEEHFQNADAYRHTSDFEDESSQCSLCRKKIPEEQLADHILVCSKLSTVNSLLDTLS